MAEKEKINISLKLKRNKEINLEEYDFSALRKELPLEKNSIEDLDKTDLDSLSSVGLIIDENNRSGTYILYDRCAFMIASIIEGLECLPIAEALEKYPWIKKKYWFKAVDEDFDQYTTALASIIPRGYFIRVKKGVKIKLPLYF